jgi:hypothetical protein
VRQLLLLHPHALQGVQVDEHIDQGRLVDDGGLAAQAGPLDAEFDGLAIRAFIRSQQDVLFDLAETVRGRECAAALAPTVKCRDILRHATVAW